MFEDWRFDIDCEDFDCLEVEEMDGETLGICEAGEDFTDGVDLDKDLECIFFAYIRFTSLPCDALEVSLATGLPVTEREEAAGFCGSLAFAGAAKIHPPPQ